MAVSEVRYVPDVTGMMAECESNYARLLKLLPETGSRKLSVTYPGGQTVTVLFEVMEDFRYTSSVRISQCAASCDWLHLPSMAVRLYHDASMAEVVNATWQQFNNELHPVGLEIDRIRLDRRGAWYLELTSGTRVHIGREDPLMRLRRMVASWPHLLGENEFIPRVVDLRYSNGFAVRWPEPRPELAANTR